MEYALLGSSGLRVSRPAALCTATFGVSPTEADTQRVADFALDQGINFVDRANSYGNQPRFDHPGAPPAEERASAEELVGRAIAARRDHVVLATKVPDPVGPGPNDGSFTGGGLSRAHIVTTVERSLRRLGTDHIDIYYIYYAHHPDPVTDVADTIGTFEDLIRAGTIRHYALSTYAGWELTEAVLTADRLGHGGRSAIRCSTASPSEVSKPRSCPPADTRAFPRPRSVHSPAVCSPAVPAGAPSRDRLRPTRPCVAERPTRAPR